MFSQDGLPDLKVGACVAANRGRRVFGEFRPRFGFIPAGRCTSGARDYGDIDGDGRLDEVRLRGILLGHGDGHFDWTVEFADQQTEVGVASADLNDDGLDDVVLSERDVRAPRRPGHRNPLPPGISAGRGPELTT